MISIIGLSSSCSWQSIKPHSVNIQLPYILSPEFNSHFTSDCPMVIKRLRISLSMAMASLRVLSWQEQSSTSASPSTACSTAEWGPRSAGIFRLELVCSSCHIKSQNKTKADFTVAWLKWHLYTFDFYSYNTHLLHLLEQKKLKLGLVFSQAQKYFIIDTKARTSAVCILAVS